MTRFLPIVLLALGLFLAFTSFAAAHPISGEPAGDGLVCVEQATGEAHATLAPKSGTKLSRCWKHLSKGMLVRACQIDPGLAVETILAPPPETPEPPRLLAINERSAAPPMLDLPPPKA